MTFNADAAPLANLPVAPGTVWACAAGATNTNGSGVDLRTCRPGHDERVGDRDRSGKRRCRRTVAGRATRRLRNPGARACSHYGIRVDQVHAHFEYAPGRKIDPATHPGTWCIGGASWDMTVPAAMTVMAKPEPPTPPDLPEDDDMTPFLIQHTDTGWHALVYGDGKVTGIDNGNTGPWIETVRRTGPDAAADLGRLRQQGQVTWSDAAPPARSCSARSPAPPAQSDSPGSSSNTCGTRRSSRPSPAVDVGRVESVAAALRDRLVLGRCRARVAAAHRRNGAVGDERDEHRHQDDTDEKRENGHGR